MLSLAIAMALFATAVLGTASAMAETTALCKEDTGDNLCPQAKRANQIHLLTQKLQNGQLVEAKAKFLTGGLTVECTILYLGTVQTAGELGSPLKVEGDFTYTECNGGCEAYETEGSPGILWFLKEGGVGSELAKVTGEATIALVCFDWWCEYNFVNLVGHFLGPLTPTHKGHLTYTDVVLNLVQGTFFCPDVTKLDALFLSLESLYVRS
jgi:hypothetical protein